MSTSLYGVPVFEKFLALAFLTNSLKLSLLVDSVSLVFSTRINRVDGRLLGRLAMGDC